MSASSSLDADIRKILKRWTKIGCYVYMRPISSTYIDASKPHKIYWRVQVELRATPPGRWNAEGYNLDDVIRELDGLVPRNRKQHHEENIGWLAPAKLEKAEAERFRKAEKDHYEAKAKRPPGVPEKREKKPKKRPVDELAVRRKKKKRMVKA